MKITRANVEQYAKEKGLEPIQIDGIPEGFSWKEPDIAIGGKEYKGKLQLFVPLKDWNSGQVSIDCFVAESINFYQELLRIYNDLCLKK